MNDAEYFYARNCRKADGPRSCTGDEPCIFAACFWMPPRWYCRHPEVCTPSNAHAFPVPNPDRTVCDNYSPLAAKAAPMPLDDLCQKFKSY